MSRSRSLAPYAIAAIAALGAAALLNNRRARQAERDNPPAGTFIDVDGVRLHYMERGAGKPLVMLHGNGSMIQDFDSSGLIDLASAGHRVIVFDRPGFGHSNRPGARAWTPQAQADLFAKALVQLGIRQAALFGHSWGTCVAIQMALRHRPMVQSLVLASGYYYPTFQPGFAGMAIPAIPVVGGLIRHTLAPLVSRAAWPLLLRKIFGPPRTPSKFAGFPKEMAVRPSQLGAAAAETGALIPYAMGARDDYHTLDLPVVLIAGDADRVVGYDQSSRLHNDIRGSVLHRLRGAGHMIHQTHTAAVMAAITEATRIVGEVGGVIPALERPRSAPPEFAAAPV